jgi:Tol biopolymer transport system component
MSLGPGTRLGPYEIVSAIGAGGMGEVYRATDTNLGRQVAIKVLPEAFAQDPERVARFEREARTLASLNHPNIAIIHGLEKSQGTYALVMELVEGEDLSERIARGPVPLDEALPIAKQIAEALEAAHEQGIIHRDLKPGNIKVTPNGVVKVLDFGLAKLTETTTASSAAAARPGALSLSPTITSPALMTGVGMLLGTAAYMAPEQARGKAVDKRTDIWAFGCVLFEMVTGKKPFDGETLTDIAAAIVKNEPDWRAFPAGTPARIQSLVARCLKKDPSQRLHDMADGRLYIEEILNEPAAASTAIKSRRPARQWAGWIAAAVASGVAVFALERPVTNSPPADPISFAVYPPDKMTFAAAPNTTLSIPSFAVSPDGRALVFSAEAPGAKRTLWVRSMDEVNARQLAGTENAQDPLWSPDSRWVAFFADGSVKKVPASGGAVQVVTQTNNDFRGGSWGPDDTILFASGTAPILSVNAAGGRTVPVTTIDTARLETTHRYPYFLPDGRHFLYTSVGATVDQSGVYVGSLDGKTKKALVHINASAVYAPQGYLLFTDGETLLGQAFDAERLAINGQTFLIADRAGRNSAFMSAVSTSRMRTIAYAGTLSQVGHLTWLDRQGRPVGSPGTQNVDYTDFRLSPDEKSLAASMVDPRTNSVEVWLTDLSRDTSFRFASGTLISASVLWSPDGSRLTFRANRKGDIEFYQRSAAGGGNDRTVLPLESYAAMHLQSANLVPTDWSPDGRQIIFSAPSPASGNDLWLLPLGGDGKAVKFIDSPGEQIHGNFSPDGRLVAYTSNESGRFEIYVETVPRSEGKWLVSTRGGYEPRWRSDGREIYYLAEDRTLMAVAVETGPSFGIPKPLFQTHVAVGVIGNRTHYVPSRDGQRFLVDMALDAPPSPITVLLNWKPGAKP